MKAYATRCEIVQADGALLATVEAVDEVAVKIEIGQVVGWNDWLDLTDAVRKAMLMMEIKSD